MSRARDERTLTYIARMIAHIERDLADEPNALDEEGTRAGRAILWSLMTLADATGKLPDPMKRRHPDIDWTGIRGFRNVAAHVYDRLQLREVHRIITDSLPSLRVAIQAELAALRGDR